MILLIFLTACGGEEDADQTTGCEGSEEVILENLTGLLDGCGWVLNRVDGTRIEPLNLNDFSVDLVDGKVVQLIYEIDSNAVSICLIGDIIRLSCFE